VDVPRNARRRPLPRYPRNAATRTRSSRRDPRGASHRERDRSSHRVANRPACRRMPTRPERREWASGCDHGAWYPIQDSRPEPPNRYSAGTAPSDDAVRRSGWPRPTGTSRLWERCRALGRDVLVRRPAGDARPTGEPTRSECSGRAIVTRHWDARRAERTLVGRRCRGSMGRPLLAGLSR
jgi:hypothetical protein